MSGQLKSPSVNSPYLQVVQLLVAVISQSPPFRWLSRDVAENMLKPVLYSTLVMKTDTGG